MSSKPRLAVELASELASRMLHPSVLDEALRSGLFIVSQLDADHLHALTGALAAELRRHGAVVIFVDAQSGGEGIGAIEQELRAKLLAVREQLMSIAPMQPSARCVKSLSELIKSIVDLNCNDLVLIIDQVGRLRAQPGAHLLKALKAARDAVNVPADANGNFFLVAVDRDPVVVNEFTSAPNQAFLGAITMNLAIA